MNPVTEEIESYFGCSSMTDQEYLEHYGMPRRSGRYPWGSGEEPYQHSRDFLGRVEEMRKAGFTYTDEDGKKWTGDNAIAKSLGYSSTDFRTVYAIAKDERRAYDVGTAKRLKEKEGLSVSEIGRRMGVNESTVRSYLNPNSESRMKQARETANFLKTQVDKKGMVDTFVGGTGGVGSGQTCTTEAVAFCGTNQCASVSVNASDITCPNGITATVENSGTSKVKITFKTTATINAACEATIPIVVDGITMNKKFSFAVARTGNTGATGKGIKSTVVDYVASASNTTVPTSGWSTTIPSVSAGQFLWTRTTITYTDNTTSVGYSVAKQGATGATGTTGSQWYSGTGITGTSTTATIFANSGVANARANDMYLNTTTGDTYKCTVAGAASAAKWVYAGNIKGIQGDKGNTGATGNGISKAEITYAASSSNTTAPTSGWQSTPPSVSAGQYLWTKTVFTYTNGGTATQYSVAKQGSTGAAGADAISLTITSSNGTVFKNNTGSTVLTAHVWKGAVEQAITDAGVCGSLGSIKWYKVGSDTAIATAKTLTVSANDVLNSQAYTCQLEG